MRIILDIVNWETRNMYQSLDVLRKLEPYKRERSENPVRNLIWTTSIENTFLAVEKWENRMRNFFPKDWVTWRKLSRSTFKLTRRDVRMAFERTCKSYLKELPNVLRKSFECIYNCLQSIERRLYKTVHSNVNDMIAPFATLVMLNLGCKSQPRARKSH